MGTISLSIPIVGQPDTTEDVKIQNNFTAIQNVINGNLDGGNVVASLTGRRHIGSAFGIFSSGNSAGNYFITGNANVFASGSSVASSVIWWHLDPANYAVTGKSTQLIVRLSVATGTAPAMTFAGGLAAVTFGAASANAVQPVIGATQGTTASVASPGAASATSAESSGGAFAFPTAGAYIPFFNLSGTPAASSGTALTLQLFVLNS